MNKSTEPHFIGMSHDQRTNRWRVSCPACGGRFEPQTTMRSTQFLICPAAKCKRKYWPTITLCRRLQRSLSAPRKDRNDPPHSHIYKMSDGTKRAMTESEALKLQYTSCRAALAGQAAGAEEVGVAAVPTLPKLSWLDAPSDIANEHAHAWATGWNAARLAAIAAQAGNGEQHE